ncbi:GHKL domain-containing protein [Mycolicibacterium iranicum]|uniref:GHKL domain-containing protein n=1 Tax=Mycolicibacterium iranicum TaxID=912594 RepID=UPI0009EE7576|nr:GHKL domain-containing protein [Mycolicibacterium iranicum]
MNVDELLQLLRSELPSERIKAAQWAANTTIDRNYKSELIRAAASEGVPRVRQLIEQAIKRIDRGRQDADNGSVTTDSGEAAEEILRNISKAIQHETESAIGRLRLCANREIADFEASATNAAIEALRRRVDGLASLAEAHRIAEREFVSLTEIIEQSISPEHPRSMFIIEFDGDGSEEIYTDPGLISLVLVNAIDNAAEASYGLPIDNARVLISANVDEGRFWITIRNGFAGTSFDLRSVGASGRTTKTGHRGMGTKVVELACERLGYEFELSASGAVATFILRGSRRG